MKRLLITLCIAAALVGGIAFAKEAAPVLQNDSENTLPLGTAQTAVDTTYLLGGPDRWDGSFETPGGLPDWHGWTHEDVSFNVDNHWHVSTYMADQIGGHGTGNHAMYCGDETIPACDPPDTIGGYGNSWFEDVAWSRTVADPSQPVTVRVTGVLNFDTEQGYDYVYLVQFRGNSSDYLAFWTATGSETFDITTVVSPEEYSGPGENEVRLAWRFHSDGGWSDYDCSFASRGACQIDDVTVFLDGAAATFDDFEPGDPLNWIPADLPGVGDFASLRNNLNSVHPCQSVNSSQQVNFIDDGLVVPGTGGTPCIDWCYGPGGWIINHDGGLSGDYPFTIRLINQVVSPPLAWPAGLDAASLEFDLYMHEPFFDDSSGMFGFWYVRSTTSSDPEDLQAAPWLNRGRIFENSSGSYQRIQRSVHDLLVPDRQWVQVALGVREAGFNYGIDGPNGTPSPYFDNVAVKTWDPAGPDIEIRDYNLFGDAFPETGTLDPTDPAANWCRVDMTGGQSPYVRGDTLVAHITPIRHGATVVEPPNLNWALKCNPVFDAVRSSTPDPTGVLRGMESGSVAVVNGLPYSGRWAFDLPDTGFFFPGDRLQYYITAADDLDGDVRTAVWPPDTTGVLDFSDNSPYPYQARINGLPTVTQPGPDTFDHPAILLVDDSRTNSDSRNVWLEALQDLGITRGDELEILTIFSPEDLSLFVNAELLGQYHTLIYSSGLAYPSLNYGGPAVVLDWLDTGGKKGLFAGDNLTKILSIADGNAGGFLLTRLGINNRNGSIAQVNGGYWELLVSPISGNGVLPDDLQWQVNAACPGIRWLDANWTAGDGQSAATLDPEGYPGGPFSAVVTVDDLGLSNRTAVMPFDIDAISGMTVGSGKSDKNFSSSTYLAYFLLTWLGSDVVSGAEDLPGIEHVAVTAHPNPFNPQTTIAFDLPRAMDVSLDIYDLQGRLVRRLLDESPFVAGGHQQVWDGRDGEGRATSSGVYFFRFVAGDQNRVGKLTLLK